MDFQQHSVDARAFALPKITSADGKKYIPVVTAMHQGRAAAGTGNEEKVPVGAGAQIAVGAENKIDTGEAWKGDAHKKPEENKAFPQKVIILLDVSPSMDGYKLNLVKEKIKDLKDVLDEKHIETVLVPYNSDLEDRSDHKDGQSVLDRVDSLITRGGTNIYKPVDEVFNIISKDDDKRNMVLLISDGQHGFGGGKRVPDIIDRARGYSKLDAGIYSIGVGAGYNEELMRGILESVGFGGAVHIPEDPDAPQVFKNLLPEFIKNVSSAPFYPTFYFSKWFDKVVNLTPSMRPVPKGKDVYRAVAGYQNDAYSVGFIEEKDFDKALVGIKVKDKANGKKVEEPWKLEIEDLDTAIGLDPTEKELIEQMPVEALKVELMKKRDADAMTRFVDANRASLDGNSIASLDGATQILRDFGDGTIDENSLRSSMSASQSFVGDQSVYMSRGGQAGSRRHDETIVGLGGDDYTVHMHPATKTDPDEKPEFEIASQSVHERQRDDLGKAYRLMKKKGDPGVSITDPKDPDQPAMLFFNEGEKIFIGRKSSKVGIGLHSQHASTFQAYLVFEKGRLYIVDTSTTNPSYINGEKMAKGQKYLVTKEDTFRLADVTIKIMK